MENRWRGGSAIDEFLFIIALVILESFIAAEGQVKTVDGLARPIGLATHSPIVNPRCIIVNDDNCRWMLGLSLRVCLLVCEARVEDETSAMRGELSCCKQIAAQH